MKVFRTLMDSPFMGNFLKPRSAPRGSPRRVARIRADPDTLMDKNIMPSNSLSRSRMRKNALVKPSMIEDIVATGKGQRT